MPFQNEKPTLREKMRSAAMRLYRQDGRIEIRNGNEVIFEGCRGILEYSSEKIRLSMGRQSVTVTGQELTIRNMFSRLIAVEGHIASVDFS